MKEGVYEHEAWYAFFSCLTASRESFCHIGNVSEGVVLHVLRRTFLSPYIVQTIVIPSWHLDLSKEKEHEPF
jgi:hypothetical protein